MKVAMSDDEAFEIVCEQLKLTETRDISNQPERFLLVERPISGCPEPDDPPRVLFFARAAPKEPAPEKFVSARSSRSVIEVNEMLGIMQKE